MASSINSGSFSNQPIKGNRPAPKGAAPGQEESDFHVQDGLTLSSPAQPEPKAELPPTPSQEVPSKASSTTIRPNAEYDPSSGALIYNISGSNQVSYDIAAREIGSNWFTDGINRIDASKLASGVSDRTFTNGLGSTQLVGLSGKVLADLNPFKS